MSLHEIIDVMSAISNDDHTCDSQEDCLACAAVGILNQLEEDAASGLLRLRRNYPGTQEVV